LNGTRLQTDFGEEAKYYTAVEDFAAGSVRVSVGFKGTIDNFKILRALPGD
jgi:hypothetical protein